jgi:hypothetical protein
MSWTCFGTVNIPNQWSWRLPTVLQLLPPVIQLPLMLRVSESPRWLISRNRHSEAKEILTRFHGDGRPDSEIVSLEYKEICEEIQSDPKGHSTNWALWLQGSGNRRRLLLVVTCTIFASWSGGNIVINYFALALNQVGITSSAKQTGINGGLQIFNFLVALISANVVDKFGRRKLFLLSSIIMLLAMVGFTVATEEFARDARSGPGRALVVLFFLFQFGYDIGYAPLTSMYVAEICPYNLRASGIALHYTLTSASVAASQYANPVALENIGWKYYLVYIAILAFEVIFTYFLFPETKGYTVEQVAKIFDEQETERSESDA